MPSVPSSLPGGGTVEPPTIGESGALKVKFYVSQAGILSFDWDRIGSDSDSAYFSVWADDPMESYRHNDWIYYPTTFQGTFSATGVDLCARYRSGPASACDELNRTELTSALNVHTGWGTKSAHISSAGWYWLGFGLGEIAEGTVPTVLALDNVQFSIPEPTGLILCFTALIQGIAIRSFARSRRQRPNRSLNRIVCGSPALGFILFSPKSGLPQTAV